MKNDFIPAINLYAFIQDLVFYIKYWVGEKIFGRVNINKNIVYYKQRCCYENQFFFNQNNYWIREKVAYSVACNYINANTNQLLLSFRWPCIVLMGLLKATVLLIGIWKGSAFFQYPASLLQALWVSGKIRNCFPTYVSVPCSCR